MAIVAMTREMGTLGKEVARTFARRTGYSVLHAELVESTDGRRQDGESEVFRFLEGSEKELDKWRSNRAKGGYLTPEDVLEIALEGDVLIRGWGATRLLKSVPNVLSVRVCAPLAFRRAQMQQRLGVDERTAVREIARSDATHSQTFLRFFGADWTDPAGYDLVLNTEHLTPELCADILYDAVDNPNFRETAETRRELTDRLLKARITAALGADPALGRYGRNIQVTVDDAEVRLYGVVVDGHSRQRAEQVASEQDGIRSLRNEIMRARSYAE